MLSSSLAPVVFAAAVQATTHHIIVGSAQVDTLFTLEYDDSTSDFSLLANISVPSAHQWLTFSHDKKNLYGTGDASTMQIVSYTVENATSLIYNTTNMIGTCATTTVHAEALQLEPYGVYGVSYGSGSNCGGVAEVDEQGVIIASIQNYTYASASSLHGNGFHPSGDYLYTADMGTKAVWTHKVDRTTGAVSFVSQGNYTGGSPRHVVAHPSGKYAYAMTESSSEVVLYNIDNSTGAASFSGTAYGIVPANSSGTHRGETARVSKSGTLLYATTRANSSDPAAIDGFVSGFTLDTEGNILSQDFIEATTTGGGTSNMVVPAIWDDNLFVIIDAIDGNVEMWQRADDGASAAKIASVPLGVEHLMSGLWYD